MNYFDKYIKYKMKYLNIKGGNQLRGQKGGAEGGAEASFYELFGEMGFDIETCKQVLETHRGNIELATTHLLESQQVSQHNMLYKPNVLVYVPFIL